jgi:CMP-N,N'-diacetyllegionaminic acid synthase
MIKHKKVLALIPARGGSKGIKNKNIIDLCGKPLIAYTVEAAKGSKYIDDIVITTDSVKIAEIARSFGAEIPFMRPDDLATDHSKTIESVVHAIQTLKDMGRHYDILVLLQPTQPLRTVSDIDEALKKFIHTECESLVSVSAVSDHPILIRSINQKDELVPLLNLDSTVRRQDMPEYYRVNGCIYINNVSEITEKTSLNDNKRPFIMETSHSVDIDEISDILLAEYYLRLIP